jgi:hypothetical protein
VSGSFCQDSRNEIWGSLSSGSSCVLSCVVSYGRVTAGSGEQRNEIFIRAPVRACVSLVTLWWCVGLQKIVWRTARALLYYHPSGGYGRRSAAFFKRLPDLVSRLSIRADRGLFARRSCRTAMLMPSTCSSRSRTFFSSSSLYFSLIRLIT